MVQNNDVAEKLGINLFILLGSSLKILSTQAYKSLTVYAISLLLTTDFYMHPNQKK